MWTPGTIPREILNAAIARGERVTQFLIADPSIEQIFIDRVGRPPSEDHHLAAVGAPSGLADGPVGGAQPRGTSPPGDAARSGDAAHPGDAGSEPPESAR